MTRSDDFMMVSQATINAKMEGAIDETFRPARLQYRVLENGLPTTMVSTMRDVRFLMESLAQNSSVNMAKYSVAEERIEESRVLSGEEFIRVAEIEHDGFNRADVAATPVLCRGELSTIGECAKREGITPWQMALEIANGGDSHGATFLSAATYRTFANQGIGR